MSKKLINSLTLGDVFAIEAYVAKSEIPSARGAAARLTLTLSDRSGEIEAVYWGIKPNFSRSFKGEFVRVEGCVKDYRDKLQATLTNLPAIIAEPEDPSHFFRMSCIPLPELLARLQSHISSVADPKLRALLGEIFRKDTEFMKRFTVFPAAQFNHHAFRHGLLHHTVEVADLALGSADIFIQRGLHSLSKDLVIAGALLHDTGKCEEFQETGYEYEYSHVGALLGHIAIGTDILMKSIERVEKLQSLKFGEDLTSALRHIILSHHGKLEYGSPVLPMFPEAEIVHRADDLSSTMNYYEEALSNAKLNEAFVIQRKLSGANGNQGRRVYVGSIGVERIDGMSIAESRTSGCYLINEEVEEGIDDISIPAGFKLPVFRIVSYPDIDDYAFNTEEGTKFLNIYGGVAAGSPMLDSDCFDGIAEIKFEGKPIDMQTHFLLRVQGDSMTGDDIQDEDLIVVKTQPTAGDNELVVVMIEEGSAVKRLKITQNSASLISSNPLYPPIPVKNLDSLRIEGVVVGVARA